jgi:RNA recognition motif-containing protein
MGYGFLEFENRAQAEEALKNLNGKPLPDSNKTFKLNWASYNTNKNNAQNPNEFSIYVCELDPSVNNEILRDFFKEKYKSVIDAKIIIDPSTKISKGYGFVKFSDKSESEKAITEMNGVSIKGKPMKTGNASYKRNEKKQNNTNFNTNFPNDLSALQSDPNFMYQQQHLLNQFYLSNGYQQNINPLTYQMYAQLSQLMSQNMPQNMNQNNMANNLQNMGNDMNTQQMQEQFLNNLAFIQMMNQGAGLGGDMSNMNNLGMMNNNENNQDSQ